jgi:hypothetical protein
VQPLVGCKIRVEMTATRVEIAPEVFRLDEVAVVIGTGPAEKILEAAESCPAVAISIVDDQTGETVFP